LDVLEFALITPLMMICIYYGIRKRRPEEIRGSTGLAGFLYGARASLCAGRLVNKGKARLWRPGVFNALFAAGAFFLLFFARWSEATRSESMVALPLSIEDGTPYFWAAALLVRFTLCHHD